MRIGVTLSTLREEVLLETGRSTEAGHAVYSAPVLNQLINRLERSVAMEFEWASMNVEEEVTVAADAQYANLPTNIDFTKIDGVHVQFGNTWLPLTHGIGPVERSIYNTTQKAVPARRWEIQAPGNVNFEIWPIGETAQTLRFYGSKKIGGMTKDTDTCVIDADVLVLFVAAEILARDKKSDADYKLVQARKRANTISKRQGAVKSAPINFGRKKGPVERPGIDFIPPS